MHQEITIMRAQGSFTFEESLAALVKAGAIEKPEALAGAHHPQEIAQLLQ
jgi:Tfp pilus assembly pilus retraction ATPase PilT